MRITAPGQPRRAVRRRGGDRAPSPSRRPRPRPTSSSALDAANAAGPTTTDGCSAFTNAAAVAGKWAYVDRGTCAFADKVANAKTAGATGIVIGNNNVDLAGRLHR